MLIDDGTFDHCSCCAHRRSAGCGGPSCPCRQTGCAFTRTGHPHEPHRYDTEDRDRLRNECPGLLG